jgi:hypothetical protein
MVGSAGPANPQVGAKTSILGMETGTAATPAAPTPTPETPPVENSWHWCPECFVAAGKPGTCPSCEAELEPVPPDGLPYGPFQPSQRKRQSRAEMMMAAIGIFALLVPLGVGLLLYRLSSGSPAAASPGDGLLNSHSSTTIHFPTLGTASIPGVWTADTTLKASIDSSLNTDGGQATVLMAARSDQSVIWMADITKSPGGSGSGSGGCSTTPISNQSPTLANLPAELDNYKLACPGDTEYVSQYTMKQGSSTLILRIMSPSSNAPFQRIENALLQMPGSSGGGVSL